MVNRLTNKRGCLGETLLLIRVLTAFGGGVLTLGGCFLGTGWVVALARGASAAELPDPTAMVYPIVMFPAGILSLLISGVLLVVSRRMRR